MWTYQFMLPVLSVSFLVASGLDCGDGWFGRKCRYKCRCVDNKCDTRGECTQGRKCEYGWFGPACQYADALVTSPDAPAWLKDEDDDTCANNVSLPLAMQVDVEITWLRTVVNNPQHIGNISFEFFRNQTACANMTSFIVYSQTRDIYCNNTKTVTGIVLNGIGVKSLCSLYVSLGRNIALRQYVTQSTVAERKTRKYGPHLAVDGLKGQNPSTGDKCAESEAGDQRPQFTLTFERPQPRVYRLLLYNRIDVVNGVDYVKHMGKFKLNLSHAHNIDNWTYQDESNGQIIFTIRQNQKKPVSRLEIVATRPSTQGKITSKYLHICELEIYGESACTTGKYGIQCDMQCYCPNTECFVSTGGCVYGCPAGRQYLGCYKVCDQGFYGTDCLQHCSDNCLNNSCDPVNGTCFSCKDGLYGQHCYSQCPARCRDRKCERHTAECVAGCSSGYKGSTCMQECDTQFYGLGCSLLCPPNCAFSCDPVSGDCLVGCKDGYQGPQCVYACDDGYYGFNCSRRCGTYCLAGLCDHITGDCTIECPSGYTGELCDLPCGKGFHGKNCSQQCSSACFDRLCDIESGGCYSCLQGKSGPNCTHDSAENDQHTGSLSRSMVGMISVLVIVSAALILLLLGQVLWSCISTGRQSSCSSCKPGELDDADSDSGTSSITEDSRSY